MQLPTTNACVAWKQYLSMFCTYESQRFFFLKEVRFFRLVCQPINQPYFSLTPNQHQSLTSQYYFSLITNHHQPPIITKRTERTLYKIVKCMQMQRRRKKTDPPCLVCSRAPLTGAGRSRSRHMYMQTIWKKKRGGQERARGTLGLLLDDKQTRSIVGSRKQPTKPNVHTQDQFLRSDPQFLFNSLHFKL